MNSAILQSHPCCSPEAHFRAGRLHLPVARKCNISCNYCDRRIGIAMSNQSHSYRPSVASTILTPQQALELVSNHEEQKWLKVAGIAGPGEPLFNRETFETLELLHKAYEELMLCVCTNGLLLPDCAEELAELGVKVITITINAVDERIAGKIYTFVEYEGKRLHGLEASRLLLSKQLGGIESALHANMLVKINSILVPGINDRHMVEVAREVSKRGAHIQNITPLIPLAGFKALRSPALQEIQSIRDTCEQFLPQFRHCRQCRADSIGIPGRE